MTLLDTRPRDLHESGGDFDPERKLGIESAEAVSGAVLAPTQEMPVVTTTEPQPSERTATEGWRVRAKRTWVGRTILGLMYKPRHRAGRVISVAATAEAIAEPEGEPVAYERGDALYHADEATRSELSDAPAGARGIFAINPAEPATRTTEAITKNFLAARLAYVKEKGWVPESRQDDSDDYDGHPATLTLIKAGPQPEGGEAPSIVAGLRLTRVGSLQGSLTWTMLNQHPEVQEEILRSNPTLVEEFNAKGKDFSLWDLTRAVSGEGAEGMKTVYAFLQIFGAAMAETGYAVGKRPRWFFFTTEEFSGFLNTAGIKHEIVYSGLVSEGDTKKSLLCYIDPLTRYQEIHDEVQSGTLGDVEGMYRSTLKLLDSGLLSRAPSATV